MKPKWVRMYLDFALRAAEESHAVRLKVGAIFVSPEGVMSMGINGLPEGGDNECEIREYMQPDAGGWLDLEEMVANWPYVDGVWDTGHIKRYRLKTKDEVSHAEENLFAKLMKQGVSTKGGMLFTTDSPCIHCAKIIVGAGITHVYYLRDYKITDGIDWLVHNGIKVIKVD